MNRGLGYRAAKAAGMALAIAGTLASSSLDAQEGDPAANEVTVYFEASFEGAAKTWALPDGHPYRSIPFVGDDMARGLGSLKVGAEVGAILFPRPFFAALDDTCSYRLGSERRPDLWWLAPSLYFAPRRRPAFGEALATANLPGESYASLLIYRRDLGPPPGVLLLEKQRTFNWNCARPTKAGAYSRAFMPIASPPHSTGCFNLDTSVRFPGSAPVSHKFTAAEELFLLLPADLDGGYGDVEHELTAALFDGLECAGETVAFAHPGSGARRFKLAEFGFGRRAKSVLITYDRGAIGHLMPPPGERPQVATTPIAVAPEPTPVEPTPSTARATTVAPAASSALTRPLGQPEPGGAKMPAAAPEARAETPETPETPVQTGLLAPRVEPRLPTSGSETFTYPLQDGYRLNACLYSERDCWEPAATAWCKTRGFARASEWQPDHNIGSLFPTLVLGDARICANFVCDSFREITCSM